MKTQFWVYMLECSDRRFYVGFTSNLETRIHEHQSGKYRGFTSKRLPVKLVWFQEYQDPNEAIRAEKQIKDWSREKKIVLIKNDWERIKFLAMRNTPYTNGK